MPRGLPQMVKFNLEKCQAATLAAVEAYNKPGRTFRTAQFLILIVIAWVALFHGIFYRKNIKPWYKNNKNRYIRIDGDPKHWELSECLKRYYENENPPARKNLEFLIGLRNKIEHRHLPELDAALYGECQAALMNLEELLVEHFGEAYGMSENLAVSLQFSTVLPSEKKKVAKKLASEGAKSVTEYIEKFRGGLPSTVLSSMKYSYNVFLVPKLENRKSAADVSIEFVKVDEASPEELSRLEKLNVLIREKKIPIANLDLMRPGQVVAKVNERSTFKMNINSHADAWRFFKARPSSGAKDPAACKPDFCVYDEAHKDYLYTSAWVERCIDSFCDKDRVRQIIGRDPVPNK